MTINQILFRLDAGEIDAVEAARLMKANRRGGWLDRLLEVLAG